MVMRLSALCAGALMYSAVACSESVGPQASRTALAQFTRAPTASDVAALRDLGANQVELVAGIDALIAHGALDVPACAQLPDVRRCDDLGVDDNPLVSVFITVVDTPTVVDSLFVVSAGGQGVGLDLPSSMIAAGIHLNDVGSLAQWERFTHIDVIPITVHPVAAAIRWRALAPTN